MSEEEARRSLRRLENEQEKLLHSPPALDSDDDPIERLGKRIARVLGVILAVALIWYLWTILIV